MTLASHLKAAAQLSIYSRGEESRTVQGGGREGEWQLFKGSNFKQWVPDLSTLKDIYTPTALSLPLSLCQRKGLNPRLSCGRVRRAEEPAEGGPTELPPCWRSSDTTQQNERGVIVSWHRWMCEHWEGGPRSTCTGFCTAKGKSLHSHVSSIAIHADLWIDFPPPSLPKTSQKEIRQRDMQCRNAHHYMFFRSQSCAALHSSGRHWFKTAFLLHTAISSFLRHI